MEQKKPGVWRCYIHFETEPAPSTLEEFFKNCREYRPTFQNSYYFVIGKDVVPYLIADYVNSFFPRCNYFLCKVTLPFTLHYGNFQLKKDSGI
ncbi:MAG: hypothetical protein K2K53_12140 [Oscillospiraceae bacterium]|nr:hypothetical protein [Oscillospiraceae bacterium]